MIAAALRRRLVRVGDIARGPLVNPAREVVRQATVRTIGPRLGQIIVNEYPKSGGTWLGQMLGAALEIPFPRHQLPPFGPCIIHGHFMQPARLRRVVVLWRDGRDVMVSWYHHSLNLRSKHNGHMQSTVGRDLGFEHPEEIRKNLPRFLRYAFEEQRHPPFHWAAFVDRWHGREAVLETRYERLRKEPERELRRLADALTGHPVDGRRIARAVSDFHIARMRSKESGPEHTRFVRRGALGEWREHFSPEACRVFDHYAGEQLIRLGYESDHAWVNTASLQSSENA